MLKKTLLCTALAVGSLAGFVPTLAQAQYTAIVRVAPPPPVQEVIPDARPGYIWAPGHHEWRDGQYVWMRGHWMADRSGYEYNAPRWVQRGNGEWYLVGGDWVARGDRHAGRYDRDRDVREDRFSRRHGPFGDLDRDGILNKDDRDRDGDGIRNHRDRYPDDWRRS
jgi:hypothetical protein